MILLEALQSTQEFGALEAALLLYLLYFCLFSESPQSVLAHHLAPLHRVKACLASRLDLSELHEKLRIRVLLSDMASGSTPKRVNV